MAAVRGYREWMGRYAGMRLIDVWYSSITDADIREAAEASGLRWRATPRSADGARPRGRVRQGPPAGRHAAFESLTAVVDGRRVILDDPPVDHARRDPRRRQPALEKVFTDYRATMPESRRDFLERYRFVDFALKVVGVGSVGTRCFVVVLEGRDENDPLILQAKEATASVLEPYLAGERAREPRPARRGRPAADAGRRPTSSSAGPAARAAATSTSASCGT